MDPLQWFSDILQKNKELVIVLVTIIGTVLFNRFIPSLYHAMTRKLADLRLRRGGRFNYNVIVRKYLNSVVLENQDLDLQGIVGLGMGTKPKLEQIFVSLRVSKREAVGKDREEEESEFKEQAVDSRIRQSGIKIKNNLYHLIRRMNSFFRLSRKIPSLTLFQVRRFWRIRLVFARDGMVDFLTYLLITSFMIISIFGLLFASELNGLIAVVSMALITFLITGGVYRLTTDFKDITNWGFAAIFSGLPSAALVYVVIKRVIVGNEPWTALAAGTAIGLVVFYAIYRDVKRSSTPTSMDRPAREIGSLITSHDRIAILGKPGAGKSTYVQYIALTFAQAKASGEFHKPKIVQTRFGISQWYFPILIPLRKVSVTRGNLNENQDKNPLFEALRQVLPFDLRNHFSDAFVEDMLKRRKCLLLFDGLDEVTNDEEFRSVVTEIKGLVSSYPGTKFIITSRYAGWRGGIGTTFIEMEVKDLSPAQVSAFIDSWYRALANYEELPNTKNNAEQRLRLQRSAEKAADTAKSLKESLKSAESIRNLANNPLLLSMICFVHYNKIPLSNQRLKLYEEFSKLLLERWEFAKGRQQDDFLLTLNQKEDIMQEIAFALHSGKIGSGEARKEVAGEEIIPIIARALERFGIDPNQAETHFQKLVNRTGLIVVTEQFKNLFSFSHLTFQEYYTAKYLDKCHMDVFEVAELSSYVGQGMLIDWWSEVIALYSNLQKNVSRIIQQLCMQEGEDFLRSKLKIAAKCFRDAMETPAAEVDDELFAQLLDLRTTGDIQRIERPLRKEVKHYLIQFTESSAFYKYALSTFVRQSRRNDDYSELLRVLPRLAQSADRTIVNAVSTALLEIWPNVDVSQILDQETLKKLLQTVDPDALLAIVRFISSKCPKPLDDEFASDVIRQTAGWYVQLFFTGNYQRLLYSGQLHYGRADQTFCEIMHETADDAFKVKHAELQKMLATILFETLRGATRYRQNQGPFCRALRKHLVSLLEVLFRLDTSEQKTEHKQQLLNMLAKGTYDQQVWALFLLQTAFHPNDFHVDILLKKLNVPSEDVRLAALSILRQAQMEEKYVNTVRRTLTGALMRGAILSPYWQRAINLIAGRGTLGSNSAERIQIAGTLFNVCGSDESVITDLLLKENADGFYRNRYEWFELLEDLNGQLNETNIERIISYSEANASKPDGLTCLMALIDLHQVFDQHARERILTIIFGAKPGQPMQLLKQLKPVIVEGSEEHKLLLKVLDDGNLAEANAAFEILIENKLV